MKETHYDKIVATLIKGWHCYGEIVEENRFCQSLCRSVCKLREKLDTSIHDKDCGLIGILTYRGKQYQWFESMRGEIKYFYLKPFIENSQPSLFNNIVQAPFGDDYRKASGER